MRIFRNLTLGLTLAIVASAGSDIWAETAKPDKNPSALHEAWAIAQSFKVDKCSQAPNVCVNVFNTLAQTLYNEKPKNDEDKAFRKKLFTELSRNQETGLPLVRKSYSAILDKSFWERDVKAYVYGDQNEVLELVGGMFAANRNISKTYEEIKPLAQKLRFQQIVFRWIDSAEPTTLTVDDVYPDFAVIAWDKEGNALEVPSKVSEGLAD